MLQKIRFTLFFYLLKCNMQVKSSGKEVVDGVASIGNLHFHSLSMSLHERKIHEESNFWFDIATKRSNTLNVYVCMTTSPSFPRRDCIHLMCL